MKISMLKFLSISAVVGSLVLVGCSGGGDAGGGDVADDKASNRFDSAKATLFQVGDEIFSIPSPVQTAYLIKGSGASYNKDILNDPSVANMYSTKVQRGLNLGIYGADLGYVTIYDQTQDAIEYIQSTKKIADELGVSSAFDQKLMKRFEKNLGVKDSILVLVTDAYRACDAFLKNNDRDDVGSMILAGGWLESLYFAVKVAEESQSQQVKIRIAEQRNTLENIIKLLQRYGTNEELAELIDELIELYYLFDDVGYSYVYKEPTTDVAAKLTTINSVSEVDFSEEQLSAISEKVQSIRNLIVG